MSSTKELIKNAIKDAEITDYIMLIRGECMTVILVEDFIKDIVFGGELICDTLLGCWKTMGQFDGGVDPDNGDDDPCNCDPDFVKIHFPKGEGVRIITDQEQAATPDSVYILKVGDSGFQLIVVDEEGNKRNLTDTAPVIDIESSDQSIEVNVLEDGGFDLKSKVIGGANTSPTGYNIFKELKDKRLQFIPIIPLNIAIEYLMDDQGNVTGLQIGNPDTFAFKTFYINENYPTYDGDGSLSRPYKTFEDCYKAYVAPLEDNPTRPGEKYNRAYPKNLGARIILLSNITTNTNPSINKVIYDTTLNNYNITYTGSDPYMIDTEVIYPLISKSGNVLNDDISIKIIGNGYWERTNDINRGLVRCWGADRLGTGGIQGKSSIVYIGDATSNLTYQEAKPDMDGKVWTDINTYSNGNLITLESIYGQPFKATSSTVYLPQVSKSLFNIKYRNPGNVSTFVQEGKLTIGSFSQTSFYAEDALLTVNEDLSFFGLNETVAYNGTTVNDTVNPVGRTWVHYIPHTGKNLMHLEGTTILNCKGFRMNENAGFGHYGWDAALYSSKEAFIAELNFKFFSIHYYNSFFKIPSDHTFFYLGTGGGGTLSELSIPNAKYLLSGGISNPAEVITCVAVNSTVFSFKDLKPASNLSPVSFETRGTLLGLKGKPIISGIIQYANAADAQSNGTVINGLYKDASKSGAITSL